MRKLFLAAGVAALAIAAPAASKPEKAGGDRGSKAAKVERGGGGQGAARAQSRGRGEARAQVRPTRDSRPQRAERRSGQQSLLASMQARGNDEARGRGKGRAETRGRSDDRVSDRGRGSQRAQANERRNQRAQAQERAQSRGERRAQAQERGNQRDQVAQGRGQRAERIQGSERRTERAERRSNQLDRVFQRSREIDRIDTRRAQQIERINDIEDRRLAMIAETRAVPLNDWRELALGGVWLNGCPPGLAKKPVPCVPPGQVRNTVGQPVSALRDMVALQQLPDRLRYVYADDDDYYYRYGNGYVYRIDRSSDLIRSLLPLFGLGYTVGQPFPSAYSNYYLPTGLQPFYADSPYTTYRYANGYVYEVDPFTGLIEDVDPVLGYGYGYGQMMPLTYSAYNVPYQYRSMYYDTPDHYYRYAPGAIYQVDPETSLITAVAALLTGGLNVGQPLPTGYGVYNVPYAYRTQYYDTPNDWYRYSNGYVYRVDPTTQLVTAIVASILT